MSTEEKKEKTTIISDGSLLRGYHSKTFATRECSLICSEGPHEGLSVPLRKPLMLMGRAEWCDIPLPEDPLTSRHHCEISLTKSEIRVRDLDSSNGIFIDGIRMYEAPLVPGLTLRVGKSSFLCQKSGKEQSVQVNFYDKSGLLVGRSREFQKLFSMLARLGHSDVPVLLLGETGTGKTTVAKALHNQSSREDGPFITVNCGAIPPSLIEASFFGSERGAFTGAERMRTGFFEQANGGTLFLDEIGELPLELQPKLLDVLERKLVRRLGGETELEVDFRLVTATHQDLHKALDKGTFREDLYYRLAVVELEIPPLHRHLEDLPLIVEFLLNKLCEGSSPPQLTPEGLRKLQAFSWPGNIRQLRNVLQRSLVFSNGEFLSEDDIKLPRVIMEGQENTPLSSDPSEEGEDELSEKSLKEQLEIEERMILLRTLNAFDWDVMQASTRLGISRASLYNRIQKFQLKR